MQTNFERLNIILRECRVTDQLWAVECSIRDIASNMYDRAHRRWSKE